MPSATHIQINVDDGIIRARSLYFKARCGNCDAMTKSLKVNELRLPGDMKPGNSLIFCMTGSIDARHVDFIGLSCGCYARGHRQIAHIFQARRIPSPQQVALHGRHTPIDFTHSVW